MPGLPNLWIFLVRIPILVIAFTIHEFAHAWTATRFGDDTPRLNGRLTLNPIVHLDPIGSLLLLVAGFGWAKPVPINPYVIERNSSAGVMWVSLAGPLSNFFLAVLAAIPFRLGLVPNSPQIIYLFMEQFLAINLILMLFNLIPIAPLDGDKIAEYLIPPSWQRSFQTIRTYGPIILIVLLFVLPFMGIDIIGWIIYPPLRALINLLTG